MPLRPPAARSRPTLTERDDAVQRALVDPAWRTQLLIGITVLNWLHQDESDREDLTELTRQLATPGQRRLRLHERWAERDLAVLAHPNTPAGAHLRGPLAYRADHASVLRRRRSRGVGRREGWDLTTPITASQEPELS